MTAFEMNLSEAKRIFPSLKVNGLFHKPLGLKEIVKLIKAALNAPDTP